METFSLGSLDKYKRLCNLTTKAVEKSHKQERGEIIKEIMGILNINRAKSKFAPLTFPRMGLLLPKEIPTKDLYTLLAKCKESGELARKKRSFATEEDKKKLNTYESAFSKYFYWSLKTKTNE